MDNKAVKNILNSILSNDMIFENEPMSRHTSFKTGGNANFLVTPHTEDEIIKLVTALSGHKYMVIGNGSNLLFADEGYDGVVIKLDTCFGKIEVSNTEITAQSGALLSKIANVAAEHELCGFEFASGIPGSLGGAVAMNAGAYGGEMKNLVISTTCVGKSGKVLVIEDHDFSYRHSIFSDSDLIILKSTMRLKKGNINEIKEKMRELNGRRKEKQPLEFPSAGSTFKRPEGFFAGKLIQDAGLMGYKIGGAMVSTKHAGFVINYNNATATDILNLIDHIKSEVYMRFGVELEPEVKIIGKE